MQTETAIPARVLYVVGRRSDQLHMAVNELAPALCGRRPSELLWHRSAGNGTFTVCRRCSAAVVQRNLQPEF